MSEHEKERKRENHISLLCSISFNTTCVFRIIDFSSEFILAFDESARASTLTHVTDNRVVTSKHRLFMSFNLCKFSIIDF